MKYDMTCFFFGGGGGEVQHFYLKKNAYCSSIYICNPIKIHLETRNQAEKRDQKCTLWIKFCNLFCFLFFIFKKMAFCIHVHSSSVVD